MKGLGLLVVFVLFIVLKDIYRYIFKDNILMQPSMANLNSPSSRVVKDSTLFRRRILRCINFGNGESSPNQFLDVVKLYLIKFKER